MAEDTKKLEDLTYRPQIKNTSTEDLIKRTRELRTKLTDLFPIRSMSAIMESIQIVGQLSDCSLLLALECERLQNELNIVKEAERC